MDLAEENPDVVAKLSEEADKARQVLGDRGVTGTGERPAGRVENPVAQGLTKD